MKRVIMLLALITCAISTVGCSKKVTIVSSTDGVIINGKESLSVTEHSGTTAKTEIDGVCTIEYYLCDTMEGCVHNIGDVYIDDMTDYKKGKYYTMYLKTEIYLYVPYGKMYIESQMILKDIGLMSVAQAVDIMYTESTKLALSSEITKAVFNNVAELNVADKEFHVRNAEIVIPGLIRVKVDDGSITGTEQVTFGDVTVAKTSSTKYDYYVYNGIVIQAAIGTDISTMITLH